MDASFATSDILASAITNESKVDIESNVINDDFANKENVEDDEHSEALELDESTTKQAPENEATEATFISATQDEITELNSVGTTETNNMVSDQEADASPLKRSLSNNDGALTDEMEESPEKKTKSSPIALDSE
jgi:hypothetical protein